MVHSFLYTVVFLYASVIGAAAKRRNVINDGSISTLILTLHDDGRVDKTYVPSKSTTAEEQLVKLRHGRRQFSDGEIRRQVEKMLLWTDPSVEGTLPLSLSDDHVNTLAGIPIVYPNNKGGKPKARHRVKRQTGKYEIELILFLDYPLFLYWLNRNNNNVVQTRQEMVDYYSNIVNAANRRFDTATRAGFTIDLVLNAFVIAESPTTTPWTQNHNVSGVIHADTALNSFARFIAAQSGSIGGIPFDHAATISGFNLVRNGNTTVAGVAKQDSTCSSQATSITQGVKSQATAAILAHEIGHSIGAVHDGSGNSCAASDGFVMAPSVGPVTSDRASNPWTFSTCSVTSFMSLLATPPLTCTLSRQGTPLDLTPYLSMEFGQKYPADTQCQILFGTGGKLCRNFYFSSPLVWDDICIDMRCFNPANGLCFQTFAHDGTQCGSQKWCQSGKCVFNSAAPTTPDNCYAGDDPDVSCVSATCGSEFVSRVMCCQTCLSSLPAVRLLGDSTGSTSDTQPTTPATAGTPATNVVNTDTAATVTVDQSGATSAATAVDLSAATATQQAVTSPVTLPASPDTLPTSPVTLPTSPVPVTTLITSPVTSPVTSPTSLAETSSVALTTEPPSSSMAGSSVSGIEFTISTTSEVSTSTVVQSSTMAHSTVSVIEVTATTTSEVPTSTSVSTTSEVPTSTSVSTTSEVPTSTSVSTTSEVPSTTEAATSTMLGSTASLIEVTISVTSEAPSTTEVPTSTVLGSTASLIEVTIPVTSEAPSTSEIPSTTEVPTSTMLGSTASLIEVTIPVTSETPSTTEVPTSTMLGSTASLIEVTIPVTSEVPSTIEIPVTSEVPSTTEVPTSTMLGSTASLIEVTIPVTSEVPSTTEIPVTSEVPSTTEVPTSTMLGSTASLIEVTIPVTSEVPSTIEIPVTSEVPSTTEVPTSTMLGSTASLIEVTIPVTSEVPSTTEVPTSTMLGSTASLTDVTVPVTSEAPSTTELPTSTVLGSTASLIDVTVPVTSEAPSTSQVPSTTLIAETSAPTVTTASLLEILMSTTQISSTNQPTPFTGTTGSVLQTTT
ncbi:mucin-2-like [Gigantopelta aegis]|uniref:mucin-2-like n=1 Tax=Gigantopelta aegis TaxID=1735272 RepID=UPI001B88B42E|nr:mucin-2-like [Gigantopelta aegis]